MKKLMPVFLSLTLTFSVLTPLSAQAAIKSIFVCKFALG